MSLFPSKRFYLFIAFCRHIDIWYIHLFPEVTTYVTVVFDCIYRFPPTFTISGTLCVCVHLFFDVIEGNGVWDTHLKTPCTYMYNMCIQTLTHLVLVFSRKSVARSHLIVLESVLPCLFDVSLPSFQRDGRPDKNWIASVLKKATETPG